MDEYETLQQTEKRKILRIQVEYETYIKDLTVPKKVKA